VTLGLSPVSSLQQYLRSSQVLTVLLYAFSIPIVGLLLAFVALAVGLSVSGRRNEIAVLRSRGATQWQVVGIVALEGLVLGGVALLAAAPVSRWIAQNIGRATSFLDFGGNPNLRVDLTPVIWRFGLVAIGLSLLAQVLPAIGAAQHTVVTYKQERARDLRKPWWQRMWLDVLLFIPALYGSYLLSKQGTLIVPIADRSLGADPFQNPLLFLVPALAVLALTMVILRLLPYLMSALAALLSQLSGIGLLLASRHLSRTPGQYAAPLVLLVLTLSLSAFTASLAQTVDDHLHDSSYYSVGADLRVDEPGQNASPLSISSADLSTGSTRSAASEPEAIDASTGPRWDFLPVTEYGRVTGLDAATRVGRYTAGAEVGGALLTGVYLGLDRATFGDAAFWRRDFAGQRLGVLMNALAANPDSVLISRKHAARGGLKPGDTLNVTVVTAGQRNPLEMQVLGTVDLFPTWYPEQDGPLFIGNLEYLFDQASGQFPYEVWMALRSGAEPQQVLADVRALNPSVQEPLFARTDLLSQLDRPERQGLLGFLSIGFVAAALLTVLGFLLFALASFRQRFIELGILRAIGLSARGMTFFLGCELAFLILAGLGVGTLLGVWTSQFYIPFLQVGSGPDVRIPPYEVQIAWPAIYRIWALFGGLFLVALVALAAMLLRMRIFQAVKLGETA
jgi:putative ABC transport system permease protein